MQALSTSVSVRAQRPLAIKAKASRPMRVNRLIVRAVDKAQVLSDVQSIIAEQLSVDKETVTADAKFVDLGADSLDTVEIMMAMEEKFGIEVAEEGAEQIDTVGKAAEMIAAQLESK